MQIRNLLFIFVRRLIKVTMKTKKNVSKKALSVLSVVIFSLIPLFLNAQGSTVEIYTTDLDGRLSLESIIPDIQEYSETIPEQMPGWPQDMDTHPNYCPSGISLVDINEDGFLEIISGSTDGSIHVWNYQGNELAGWPKTGLNKIQSKVAVGDIDPDYPGLEILAASKQNKLYAWHNDGTEVTGWPLTLGETEGFRSPVLFDIDGDGFLEIILGQKIYPDGHVIVFNRDGTIYPGWPQPLDYMCVATPTVGDVDNDGVIEICAISVNSIFLWDKDGVLKPGWPIYLGLMSYAQPVFADLDDDGDFEILQSYYSGNINYVGIYHHDGSVFENWPQIYPGPQTYVMPIVGDIDDDYDLEIFGGCHGYGILERHHNGDTVAGWPVDIYNLECSPIIFDLDNDGSREIVFGDNAGSFYAYNGDGSPVEDWPIPAGGNAMVNSAAVGDVDGDGDIEIALVVGNGTVNLWTIEDVPYRKYLTDWGTFYHDNWNTGWMHPSKPQNLTADVLTNSIFLGWNANTEPDLAGYNIYKSDISGGPYAKINSELVTDTTYLDVAGTENDFYCVTAVIKACTESRLSNEADFTTTINNSGYQQQFPIFAYPNPFNQSTTISFSVEGSDKNIQITIHNFSGQKIKTLVDKKLNAGKHQVIWNGTDDSGNQVSSGIYFYKMKHGDKYTGFKKMILMK